MRFRYLAVASTLGMLSTPVLADLSEGLVAHYPFDGNADDASGNGNHGYEGITYVTGKIGQAASFDGVDDYVEGNSILPFNGTSKYSISGWFNTTKGGTFLDSTRDGVGTSRSAGLVLSIGSNDGRFYISVSSDGVDNRFTVYNNSSDYRDGNWHHFVVRYNGNLNFKGIEIVIDDVKKLRTLLTGRYTQDSISSIGSDWSEEIQIGRIVSLTSTGYYQGKVDDAQERVITPLIEREIEVVIPPKKNRVEQRPYDKVLYQARHLIDNFFAKLKQFRGIATRYDKRSMNFLGGIDLAASAILLA